MTGHGKTKHPHETSHYPHWPLTGVLFLFVLLLAAFSVHTDATWLHIRTGSEILAKRALPIADTFSYTVWGQPWTTDSWLSDVLFRHLDHSAPWALSALKCVVAAAAFALLLPVNPASPLTAAGVLALAAAAAWPGLSETPGIFDFILLALLVRVLRPKRRFSWSTAAQVAVIELLWSNLHGSAALLGVWLVGLKVVKTSLHAGRGERLRFGALLIAALAGLALNPHGPAVVTQMFSSVPAVDAWPPLSAWVNLYALFLLAGGAACWICLQEEFVLSLTAATLLAVSLLAPSWRPLYGLAVAPVITLALAHFFTPLKDTPGRVAKLSLVLVGMFGLHWYAVYMPLGRSRSYDRRAWEGTVSFLRANGVNGRMFNDSASGDALLAMSGRQVFVDSRAGLYGPAFIKDAAQWPTRFKQMAEAYRFDYAVVRNRRAAYPARILDQDADWRLAYADDTALIYARKSGSAGWLVANLPQRQVCPNQLWPDALDPLLAQPTRRARIIEELDRWIVQAPESIQPLLWKAYALDRANLPQKAEHLLRLARARMAADPDPELKALLGFVLDKRGRSEAGRRQYYKALVMARRGNDRGLQAALFQRLSEAYRRDGYAARADRLAAAARRLAAPAAE